MHDNIQNLNDSLNNIEFCDSSFANSSKSVINSLDEFNKESVSGSNFVFIVLLIIVDDGAC